MSSLIYFRIWNQVSRQWLGAENMVEWYHQITGFVVLPRYIPLGKDVNTDPGEPPMGPNKDQLPQDLNVTFFFDYSIGAISKFLNLFGPFILGTIETIEIKNISNNGTSISLGVWEVTDKFNAKDFRISYSFPDVIL